MLHFLLGVGGTAAKRLRTDLSAGRAHLKTGSLESVSAIAGYVLNAQNKGYDVVMMINLNKAQEGKSAQNSLIKWLQHLDS